MIGSVSFCLRFYGRWLTSVTSSKEKLHVEIDLFILFMPVGQKQHILRQKVRAHTRVFGDYDFLGPAPNKCYRKGALKIISLFNLALLCFKKKWKPGLSAQLRVRKPPFWITFSSSEKCPHSENYNFSCEWEWKWILNNKLLIWKLDVKSQAHHQSVSDCFRPWHTCSAVSSWHSRFSKHVHVILHDGLSSSRFPPE